jgi:beta-glucosidase-like glycosyl hydrolase
VPATRLRRLGVLGCLAALLTGFVALAVAGGRNAEADVIATWAPDGSTIDGQSTGKEIYRNPAYSARERAADLVSRMTLPEKIQQAVTNAGPAIPRLGVQEYTYWSEALNGVVSLGSMQRAGAGSNFGNLASTIFPTNLSLSSSWNPALSYEKGSAISDEARGFLDKSLFNVKHNNLGPSVDDYGSLTFFAPTVNMGRDTLWGRNDEAFGEDPYLAAQMSMQFVNGFQGQRPDGTSINDLKAVATASTSP